MYKIIGRLGGVEEEIDETDTKQEADFLLQEYRTAFGTSWTLWVAEGVGHDDNRSEG